MADDILAGLGNRHVVDKLAQVRQAIKVLQSQEAALRDQVLDLPVVERRGDEYEARVDSTVYETVRIEDARQHVPPAILAKIVNAQRRTVVRVTEITGVVGSSKAPLVRRALAAKPVARKAGRRASRKRVFVPKGY